MPTPIRLISFDIRWINDDYPEATTLFYFFVGLEKCGASLIHHSKLHNSCRKVIATALAHYYSAPDNFKELTDFLLWTIAPVHTLDPDSVLYNIRGAISILSEQPTKYKGLINDLYDIVTNLYSSIEITKYCRVAKET